MRNNISNLTSGQTFNDERPDMLKDFTVHLIAGSKSPQTVKKRIYDLTRLQKYAPLHEVTRDMLEQYLAKINHFAPETRRGMLASWRVFYEWAQATGRLEDNPTFGMAIIKIPHRYPRIAPDQEVLDAIQRAPVNAKAMILLARLGCLRLTEIATLPQKARQQDRLTFIGKGNKERTIYLHPDLENVLIRLEQLHAGSPFYFPGRFDGSMHPMSVNKIITRITGWNPHSLRHAGATAAYNATKDLRAVQAMLGHSSLATTQRYLHVDEHGLRAAALGASILGRHLRAA